MVKIAEAQGFEDEERAMPIGQVFRSEDVSAQDRFDRWRELLGRTRAGEMTSAHAGDFQARMTLLELGPVRVWPIAMSPTRFRLRSQAARSSEADTYHLTFLREGELALERAGRHESFTPGDLHMVDDCQPFDLDSRAVPQSPDGPSALVRGIGVDFPKESLPLPEQQVRTMLGQKLPSREGAGALLAGVLAGLEDQAKVLGPAEASHLSSVVLDLVAAWLSQALGKHADVAAQTRQHVLMKRIQAFIRRNLGDPGLSPPAVAEAHHISRSYLHILFRRHSPEETVAACIRRLRLQAIRDDLTDAALLDRSVQAVAARWGLPDASSFSRSFREAYGIPPAEYRRQALSRS